MANRLVYEERKRNGLCPVCGDPNTSAFKICETCRRVGVERSKSKKAQGICRSCSNVKSPGKSHCESCLERQRAAKQAKIANGKCVSCGDPPAPGRTLCINCLNRKRRKTKKSVDDGICPSCTGPLDFGRKSCSLCLNKKQVYREKIRDEVFKAYGGFVCSCCDEDEPLFMTIDHVHGIDKTNAEIVRCRSGMKLYHYLRKNNYPSGFQVLCHNCNFAKGQYGICPHQKESKCTT